MTGAGILRDNQSRHAWRALFRVRLRDRSMYCSRFRRGRGQPRLGGRSWDLHHVIHHSLHGRRTESRIASVRSGSWLSACRFSFLSHRYPVTAAVMILASRAPAQLCYSTSDQEKSCAVQDAHTCTVISLLQHTFGSRSVYSPGSLTLFFRRLRGSAASFPPPGDQGGNGT